ncbi:MAG: T9SS type A sorting domain-containing protein [Balneolales bacterium]|nr:T9SS type A sorting domain-containing protein [Balneolales bacterium]
MSLDGGESWSEIISDTSRIQLSGPSLSPFSGFYVGIDTQLYYWNELSGELDLALTLEKPITGLYSSSNSDIEFILTTDELLALDPNTGETTILKVLSVSNETNPELPNRLQLHQNYPNPFNPSTIIPFELNQPSQVQLVVFDALGRQVAVLLDEHRSAGLHRVSFNASGLSSGVYFYELSSLTNGLKARRNMLFIK